MKTTGQMLARVGRVLAVLLVLAAALLATGCGKDGKIFGRVYYDGVWVDGAVYGFPSNAVTGVYYLVSPGSYDVYYMLHDGTYYYPDFWYDGDGAHADVYFHYVYTVETEKGSLMVDGTDHQFTLYLAYEGMTKIGDVRSIESRTASTAGPLTGTRSWTEDGLKITVTGSIVKLTAEQVSQLPKTTFTR